MQSYERLRCELLRDGVKYREPRTGEYVHALPRGVMIHVESGPDHLQIPSNRRYYLKTAAAETVWKWRGDEDSEFLRKHNVKIWEPFVDEGGIIPGAYGWMYRHAYAMDQLDALIDRLRTRPYGRRAVVQTMHPDYVEPCEQGFACSVVGDRLLMHLTMRSSDFAVGLPYDLMSAQMLHHEIARQINKPRGCLSFSIANSHYYERHANIMRYPGVSEVARPMPDISLDDNDAYVEYWTGKDYKHPYRPKAAPTVVK